MADNVFSGNKILWTAVAAILAIVIGAAATTISTVTSLEPQIQRLQRDVDQHDQWIADWPSTGELSADVRQTKDIQFIYVELEEIWEDIDASKERIRSLETKG